MTDDELKEAAEMAEMLITGQLIMCSIDLKNPNDIFKFTRTQDQFVRGYIFGLADALANSRKPDNDSEVLAIIMLCFHQLFGEEIGQRIFNQSFDEQHQHDFSIDRFQGGNEYVKFINSEGICPPFGLVKHLNNMSHQ